MTACSSTRKTIFRALPVFFLLLCLQVAPARGVPANAQQISAINTVINLLLLSGSRQTIPDTSFWNETAVRKVLQTFAYGGFPTDAQITLWAEMTPGAAIDEIMTFAPYNSKLSPPDFDNLHAVSDGSLEGLGYFFSSDSFDNHISADKRSYYDVKSWSAPQYNWMMAISSRGLNQFRHRIGLWETNYHMSVNQDVGIFPHPIARHYDNVIDALEYGSPYEEVLARGALNAAVAYQYGHNYNRFRNEEFEGNEDFAREFHQLFFGILGDGDHDYHELISIKNTAMALTGMEAYWHPAEEGGPDIEITFNPDTHHTAPLEILHTSITGTTAEEKIQQLAQVAIEHEESLDNLPVMIIQNLADDNLTPARKALIRQQWRSMETKDLLAFLKWYATSELFHSPDRIKYHTSIDRIIFLHNQMILSNRELYDELYNPRWRLAEESIAIFRPRHNVFGHQNGSEAFNSPAVFKHACNLSTESIWYFQQLQKGESSYVKDWQHIIPKSSNGKWVVKDVARWLWQRFIADGWKHYGMLEQAHITALLSSGHDLGFLMVEHNPNTDDPSLVYTEEELADLSSVPGMITYIAGECWLKLDDPDDEVRRDANIWVQRAVAFIMATPYTFLEEGG